MPAEVPSLTVKLRSTQQKAGQPDRVFSPRLGVSIDHWRLIRQGLRHYPIYSLAAILREFPDLEPEVLNYIRNQEKKETRIS